MGDESRIMCSKQGRGWARPRRHRWPPFRGPVAAYRGAGGLVPATARRLHTNLSSGRLYGKAVHSERNIRLLHSTNSQLPSAAETVLLLLPLMRSTPAQGSLFEAKENVMVTSTFGETSTTVVGR